MDSLALKSAAVLEAQLASASTVKSSKKKAKTPGKDLKRAGKPRKPNAPNASKAAFRAVGNVTSCASLTCCRETALKGGQQIQEPL